MNLEKEAKKQANADARLDRRVLRLTLRHIREAQNSIWTPEEVAAKMNAVIAASHNPGDARQSLKLLLDLVRGADQLDDVDVQPTANAPEKTQELRQRFEEFHTTTGSGRVPGEEDQK